MDAKETTSIMAIALAVVMIAGLIAIPVLEQAEAANPTSESRDKGQQGDRSSGGKRHGQGGGIDI